MTLPGSRPELLKDASASFAYAQWLSSNALVDSDANAWRFVAESGMTLRPSSETRSRTSIRWIPITSIILGVLVLAALISIFAITSARHWTKVDTEATYRTEHIPSGRWIVTQDDKDVCFVGQDWTECTNLYIDQWNYACADRTLTEVSTTRCDEYYEMILAMQTTGAEEPWSTVASLGDWGRLSITEERKPVQVGDSPERTHPAVCYLGVLGECE